MWIYIYVNRIKTYGLVVRATIYSACVCSPAAIWFRIKLDSLWFHINFSFCSRSSRSEFFFFFCTEKENNQLITLKASGCYYSQFLLFAQFRNHSQREKHAKLFNNNNDSQEYSRNDTHFFFARSSIEYWKRLNCCAKFTPIQKSIMWKAKGNIRQLLFVQSCHVFSLSLARALLSMCVF